MAIHLEKKEPSAAPGAKSAARDLWRGFFLLGFMGLTRLSGFLRTARLAFVWGLSAGAASYDFAFALVSSLYECSFGAWIGFCFIPAYQRQKRKEAPGATLSCLPLKLFVFLLAAFLPIVCLAFPVLPYAAPALSGFEAETTGLLALLVLDHGVLALVSLFSALYQAEDKPLFPALLSALSSLAITGIVWVTAPVLPPAGAILFLLCGNFLTLLFLHLPLSLAASPSGTFTASPAPTSFSEKKRPFHTARTGWEAAALSAFLPLSALIASQNAACDSASDAAACGYARKLVLLCAALLAACAHALWYPRLSRANGQGTLVKKSCLLSGGAALLLAFALLAGAPWLVSLLFSGETPENQTLLFQLLCFFVPALPALTLIPMLSETAFLREQAVRLLPAALISLLLQLAGPRLFSRLFPSLPRLLQVPVSFTAAVYCYVFLIALSLLFSAKKSNAPDPVPF